MLKTRILTAVVALATLGIIFWASNPQVITYFFASLVALSTIESAQMLLPRLYREFTKDSDTLEKSWLGFLIFSACIMFGLGAKLPQANQGVVLMFGLLCVVLVAVFVRGSIEKSVARALGSLLCVVYSVFPWLAVEKLYQFSHEYRYVYLLCAIVWAGDTGAYFVGKSLGKHKLAPSMSPNKTWEGAFGGIAASIIGGSAVKIFLLQDELSWLGIILCSVLGGVFGQLGDLTESAFKRFGGLKDSGKIFPGHGGFLDRVDGLLFAAPVIWLVLSQIGI